jgi:hypothetical protein
MVSNTLRMSKLILHLKFNVRVQSCTRALCPLETSKSHQAHRAAWTNPVTGITSLSKVRSVPNQSSVLVWTNKAEICGCERFKML